MVKLLIATLFVFLPQTALGQAQVRLIVHPILPLGDQWYVSAWVISNTVFGSSDDLNLFAGIGRKQKNWSVDVLLQRHLATQNLWLLDIRSDFQVGKRASLYIEAAPFLGKRGLYNFASFDFEVWPRLNFGVETENVHRPGRKDSLGVGPRAGYVIAAGKHAKLIVVGSYQVRRSEPGVGRLYVICPVSLKK